jgi:ferrous iron transport protein B
VTSGSIRGTDYTAIDTPGIYSIFSTNEDAQTSKEILIHHNEKLGIQGIIFVADAKNLTRSISIALQYADFGIPMIFALNMTDESASLGITIDTKNLSETLGISVVSTNARDGIGISRVISHLPEMRVPAGLMEYPDWLNDYFQLVENHIRTKEISSRVIGILLLTGDISIEKYIESRFGPGMLAQLKSLTMEYMEFLNQPASIMLTNLYYKKAEQITNRIRKMDLPYKSPFIEKFGGWCTSLSTGLPIAVLVLFILYQFIGTFGATFLVDTINTKIFETMLIPAAQKMVEPIPNAFFRDMIVDPDFGILPTGVFLAFGLVLPVLFCFYIAFGILEDSGYLSRFSILLDKVFQKMGLNGKGVIPLAMGFSCITMALLTTRMLDTEKEKNIATFLLLLGLPCAPLIAVMFIILGKMPVSASIAVFGIIFFQIFIAGLIANKILPGKRSPLIMVIPNMRLPKPGRIVKSAAAKTYFFMKEAIPVFILASVVVFLFDRIGGLALLEQLAKPIIKDFMGLPEKSVQVFIKTIIRRENGATEIEHLSGIYSNLQLVVNLLVMTFLFPCINAAIVLFKERGTKVAATIMTINVIYAILIGSIVNHACRILGITFT